jgi:hypothetical protein
MAGRRRECMRSSRVLTRDSVLRHLDDPECRTPHVVVLDSPSRLFDEDAKAQAARCGGVRRNHHEGMAKKPAKRYQTAGELAAAARRALQALGAHDGAQWSAFGSARAGTTRVPAGARGGGCGGVGDRGDGA